MTRLAPCTEYVLVHKEQHELEPDLGLLDADERVRYQRLLSPQKQLEFLTGRTFLKQVLAECLAVRPQTISLSLTTSGKPYLPALAETNRPFFNLSHAAGHYLIGLSRYPIGVDIEPLRPIDLTHVRHFLCPDEWQSLLTSPEATRLASFFRLFTAKEAFLKATDKRWKQDEIQFQLENQQWRLGSPTGSFQVFQTEYKDCFVAVCLDLLLGNEKNVALNYQHVIPLTL
jgi:4'-phosphopantetheinyl transferase